MLFGPNLPVISQTDILMNKVYLYNVIEPPLRRLFFV